MTQTNLNENNKFGMLMILSSFFLHLRIHQEQIMATGQKPSSVRIFRVWLPGVNITIMYILIYIHIYMKCELEMSYLDGSNSAHKHTF